MTKLMTGLIAAVAATFFISIANDASSAEHKPEGKLGEYTDNEYGYTFQFPPDWQMVTPPPKGDSGEVRVVMKSPKSTMLMISIGKVETSISEQAFINNPNRTDIVDTIIDHTIESIYRKTSRDMGATRMLVADKRSIPSEMAVKFFVSTMHFSGTKQGELPVVVAGIHYIPFEKDYLITLIMTNRLNPKDTDENETLRNVFSSFHLVGEKPL